MKVGSTSVVAKTMMKSMGWEEGQGLGKSGQGMKHAIKPTKKVDSGGIGAVGSSTKWLNSANAYDAILAKLNLAYSSSKNEEDDTSSVSSASSTKSSETKKDKKKQKKEKAAVQDGAEEVHNDEESGEKKKKNKRKHQSSSDDDEEQLSKKQKKEKEKKEKKERKREKKQEAAQEEKMEKKDKKEKTDKDEKRREKKEKKEKAKEKEKEAEADDDDLISDGSSVSDTAPEDSTTPRGGRHLIYSKRLKAKRVTGYSAEDKAEIFASQHRPAQPTFSVPVTPIVQQVGTICDSDDGEEEDDDTNHSGPITYEGGFTEDTQVSIYNEAVSKQQKGRTGLGLGSRMSKSARRLAAQRDAKLTKGGSYLSKRFIYVGRLGEIEEMMAQKKQEPEPEWC